MKNNWKQIFEGEYLDIWQTPKGKDGKSDFVLAVGGTHLFLNANTVFPELKIATDAVNREMSKPEGRAINEQFQLLQGNRDLRH